MVAKIITQLSDDLDGSEATVNIHFGLEGTNYEIDLSDVHADELHNVLEPYVTAGRRVTKKAPQPSHGHVTSNGKVPVDKDRLAAIRAWAAEAGIQVSPRGRIKADVVAQYDAAHG